MISLDATLPEPLGAVRIVVLGGCFWGLELALSRLHGVSTRVGYAGGRPTPAPTYYNLDANGNSEAVEVTCDRSLLDDVLRECVAHSSRDPSPASNPRYRRAVLCPDEATAGLVALGGILDGTGFAVAGAGPFVEAEPYHRRYYERTWS